MRRRILLLTTIALPSMSVAAEPAADNPQSTIVVTGQRVPDALEGEGKLVAIKDVPQGISVVTREIIDLQQPFTLSDIVRNTPSISNFRNSSETFRTISVRGFVQNETTTDGLRNTDALNIQPDGLANIERVEVIRGAAGALYGRGSLGASVNIVTKKPFDALAARIDLTGGSRSMASVSADFNAPLGGGFSTRVIGAYESRDSFVQFSPLRGFQLAPSLAWDGGTTRALVQLDYRERSVLRYIGLPLYGTIRGTNDLVLPIGLNLGEPTLPPTINAGLQVTASVERDLSSDWSMRVAGRYTRNTYDQQAISLRTLAADNRTLSRSYNRFVEAQDEYAAFASLDGKVTTGSIEHELRFAIDHARFTYDSLFLGGAIGPINIANPVHGLRPVVFSPPFDDTVDRITATGVSVQDRITLFPGLKLLLGGRYDWIDTQRRSKLTGQVGRRTPSAFSPRAGATFDVTPNVTLYGSWGRNIESQNNGGSNATLTPFDPIRGEQYEAGVKLSQNERVAATFGVYRIEATGVLTADPSSTFSIPTGRRRSQGVEAEINWQPIAGLSLLGYASYIDAQITADTRLPTGTQIQNVPKWQARLFASYEAPEGALAGFGLNGAVTYLGSQPGNLAAVATRFTVPSSTIVDAGISYRTGPLRVAVQARNLLDQRHFIRGAFDGRNIIPGDPRTIFVSLSYAWQERR
jgi:iron complex outermembrane recepter protein